METDALTPPSGALPDVLSSEEAVVRGTTARTQAANALVVALTRAARSFLLYDSANQAIHNFLAELHAASEAYRTRFGALILEIRPFEIATDGEVVYLDRNRERSLAFRLYRDGARRLELSADVPWHEVLKLLEIVSIRFTGIRQAEDDMVVLLWKAGFVEIQVEAVEGVTNEKYEEKRSWRSGLHIEAPDQPAPLRATAQSVRYVAVFPEEHERLLREDESSSLPHLCVRLGYELLSACANGSLGWYEIAPQLAELRDFLLAEGLLPYLLELVQALIHTPLRTPHENLRRAQFLATFADEAALGRVLRGMRANTTDAPPELSRLLALCPGDHVETLLALVVGERSEVGRRVARALLQQWVPSHGEALLERAVTADGALAVELLRVFRYADPGLCLDAATRLCERQEVGVQLAVVNAMNALSVQTPPRTIQTLLASTSIEVRMATLDHVARRGLRSVFPALLTKVTRNVQNMETREADAYAFALAGGDAQHALEAFREWVRPQGVFTVLSPAQSQLMLSGIAGLARIPGEEPEQLIKHAGDRGGSAVQAAATAAMRERRRAGVR